MVGREFLAAFLNPATNIGTARWVALGVAAYDAASRGMTPANGMVLLVLAVGEIAGRFFTQPPVGPFTLPPVGPSAVPA